MNGPPQCISAVIFFFWLILPIKTVARTNKIFKIKQLQDRKGAIKPIHNEMGLWNQQTVKDWRPVFEGMEVMLSHRLVSITVSEVTNRAEIEQVNLPALGTQKELLLLLRLWAALWWCPLQHPYSQVQFIKTAEHLQRKFNHFVSLCFKHRVCVGCCKDCSGNSHQIEMKMFSFLQKTLETIIKITLCRCLLISHALSFQSIKSSNNKVKKTALAIKSLWKNGDPSLVFGP